MFEIWAFVDEDDLSTPTRDEPYTTASKSLAQAKVRANTAATLLKSKGIPIEIMTIEKNGKIVAHRRERRNMRAI